MTYPRLGLGFVQLGDAHFDGMPVILQFSFLEGGIVSMENEGFKLLLRQILIALDVDGGLACSTGTKPLPIIFAMFA